MLGIGPQLVKEIRARRLSWTLWAPLVLAPVSVFVFKWMTGTLDRPLDRTFWLNVAGWHGYFLAWVLYFAAVPPLGFRSDWNYRKTHPFGYWSFVVAFGALTAFYVHLAFSKGG